ncbi:tetratricopeptide repeat protein [Methanolobus sp. ZRKC2]|uniref:tetratricopeptide repeat protein n=1 Tax=Methanolobus sp. ZRKC2 TaxID=3125783 RepID=UPI00324FC98C
MRKKEQITSRKWTLQGVKEKDPERKMHFFDLALELDPYDVVALNNKGMLHHKKEEFEEAIRCYDRILVPGNLSKPAPVLYNKSLALESLGKYEAALNFTKEALKQDPDHDKARKLQEDIIRLMETHEEPSRKKAKIPSGKLAVNIVYTEWQPPAVSTLLAYSMKFNQREIKYHKGFGEDLIKEKAIQDKLSRRIYCCRTCSFQESNVCKYSKTKGMAVSETAICRHFKPGKTI